MSKTAPQGSRKDKKGYNGSPNFLPKMFSFDKQLSRVTHPNESRIPESKVQDKDAWQDMYNTLPGYFHNQGSRFGAEHSNQKTLRHLKYPDADYNDPRSTFCDKKLFRVNPETQQPVGKPIKHKKSKSILFNPVFVEPTFIQLLSKNGYVVEDSSKEKRQRAWHVPSQAQKMEHLESDSDDDYN